MTNTRDTFTTAADDLLPATGECSGMSPAPETLLTDELSKNPPPPPTGEGKAPPPSNKPSGVEVMGFSLIGGGWSPAERGRVGIGVLLPLLPW